MVFDSVADWPFLTRHVVCAKQSVEDREVDGVVDVDRFFLDAVVPVVESRRAQNVLHESEMESHVRMHEHLTIVTAVYRAATHC